MASRGGEIVSNTFNVHFMRHLYRRIIKITRNKMLANVSGKMQMTDFSEYKNKT